MYLPIPLISLTPGRYVCGTLKILARHTAVESRDFTCTNGFELFEMGSVYKVPLIILLVPVALVWNTCVSSPNTVLLNGMTKLVKGWMRLGYYSLFIIRRGGAPLPISIVFTYYSSAVPPVQPKWVASLLNCGFIGILNHMDIQKRYLNLQPIKSV